MTLDFNPQRPNHFPGCPCETCSEHRTVREKFLKELSPEPSLAAARKQADVAIQQVTAKANKEWKDAAYEAGIHLARTRTTFIADDFHPLLEGLEVHDGRALGGVIRKLVKDRVIAPVKGEYRPSRRRHGTPQQVWTGVS